MKKLIKAGLLAVVLLLCASLYLGQTRDVNAAGTLSVEEMGKIRGGCYVDEKECPYKICESEGSCDTVNHNKACSATGDEACTYCAKGSDKSERCKSKTICVGKDKPCPVDDCSSTSQDVLCGYLYLGFCKKGSCEKGIKQGSCAKAAKCI